MSNLKETNLDFFNKILKKNKEKDRLQKKVIKPNNKYEFDDLDFLPKEPKIKIIEAPKEKAVKPTKEPKVKAVKEKKIKTPKEKAVKSSEYYEKNRDLILQKKKINMQQKN